MVLALTSSLADYFLRFSLGLVKESFRPVENGTVFVNDDRSEVGFVAFLFSKINLNSIYQLTSFRQQRPGNEYG